MRNLWIFINRYNAFFLFIIFFAIGIFLTIKNNAYQRSITVNSTNQLVGNVYTHLNVLKKYMNLGPVNDSLSIENAKLKTEILALKSVDTTKEATVTDTSGIPQYTYLPARVIKNSITNRNNYITINKGKLDGLESGMPVISPNRGVVGYIRDLSDHFATITSLLHKDTKISVTIQRQNAVGTLVWGNDNSDYRLAHIEEIPNHVKLKVGDTVVTSLYSTFPSATLVGTVSNPGISTGENFKTIELKLFNDFSSLQYVYIIKNKFAKEQQQLEAQLPNEQ